MSSVGHPQGQTFIYAHFQVLDYGIQTSLKLSHVMWCAVQADPFFCA